MKINILPRINSKPAGLELGKRIYQARIECGLSQIELAKEVGWKSATVISLIEADERGVSAHKLWLIAHVTAKPIDFFFTTP